MVQEIPRVFIEQRACFDAKVFRLPTRTERTEIDVALSSVCFGPFGIHVALSGPLAARDAFLDVGDAFDAIGEAFDGVMCAGVQHLLCRR